LIVIDSEFVHHENAQFLLAFKYGQGDNLSQLISVANTWMWKILCKFDSYTTMTLRVREFLAMRTLELVTVGVGQDDF